MAWAIMYDIGPILPDKDGRLGVRRYELDLIVGDSDLHWVRKLKEVTGNVETREHMLRAGYRELPENATIESYAGRLIAQYGGEMSAATEARSDIRTLLFKGSQRAAGRRLLSEEGFIFD